MLHRETVEPHTLELLRLLNASKSLAQFRLVGGTALSLTYGHRISVDLDFFGLEKFGIDQFRLSAPNYADFQPTRIQGPIYQFMINRIKIDIVEYPYPWIDEPVVIEEIRMASDKDIAAMKINAITNRGSKKDFIDLYALLQKYSYKEIMSFYLSKYPDGNVMLAIRSLCYFEDADSQEVIILWDVSWEEIKDDLTEKYLAYFDKF